MIQNRSLSINALGITKVSFGAVVIDDRVAKRSAAERVSGVSGGIMQGTSTHLSLNSHGYESVFFIQT